MRTMQFIRLTDLDDPIIDKICNVLKNAYSNALSVFFIYRDPNYKRYLCGMIERPDVYVFYVSDYLSNDLTGFVLLEVEKNVVYLRNIIVNHHFSHYNIGSRIFYRALNIIKNERNDVDMLYLDAFTKNSGVIKWYLSIGMEINMYLYWYDITDLFETSTIDTDDIDRYFSTQFVVDVNGFKKVVFNDQEIGTLIQEKYLVVKTLLTKDILNCIKYCFFSVPLLSVCLMSNEVLNLKLIEKSAQLVVNLKTLEIKDY
jgi:hypothetical protein